jgi:hypothetical protein
MVQLVLYNLILAAQVEEEAAEAAEPLRFSRK